jgi:outer membrane immunogenic protein
MAKFDEGPLTSGLFFFRKMRFGGIGLVRFAIANVKANFVFTDTFATAAESGSISTTRVGWSAGAGGEYALMNGWSVKAEYLYVDLGRATTTSTNLTAFTPPIPFPSNIYTHSVDLRSNIARVGLNYKFGGPVVAKY